MKTFKINIPKTDALENKEARMLLASKLYGKGKLSLGQASKLAKLSKRVFMQLLGDYGVSVFNYSANDLDKDIENAKNYHL